MCVLFCSAEASSAGHCEDMRSPSNRMPTARRKWRLTTDKSLICISDRHECEDTSSTHHVKCTGRKQKTDESSTIVISQCQVVNLRKVTNHIRRQCLYQQCTHSVFPTTNSTRQHTHMHANRCCLCDFLVCALSPCHCCCCDVVCGLPGEAQAWLARSVQSCEVYPTRRLRGVLMLLLLLCWESGL